MHSFTIEYDTVGEARAAVDRLMRRLGITGEFGIRPVDGKWRLYVQAERAVREATIDSLKGRRIKV